MITPYNVCLPVCIGPATYCHMRQYATLKSMKPWEHAGAINTDKAPAYRAAITELKAEGKCPPDTVHRQVKYLNNIIEADHGKLKRLINRCGALNR